MVPAVASGARRAVSAFFIAQQLIAVGAADRGTPAPDLRARGCAPTSICSAISCGGAFCSVRTSSTLRSLQQGHRPAPPMPSDREHQARASPRGQRGHLSSVLAKRVAKAVTRSGLRSSHGNQHSTVRKAAGEAHAGKHRDLPDARERRQPQRQIGNAAGGQRQPQARRNLPQLLPALAPPACPAAPRSSGCRSPRPRRPGWRRTPWSAGAPRRTPAASPTAPPRSRWPATASPAGWDAANRR